MRHAKHLNLQPGDVIASGTWTVKGKEKRYSIVFNDISHSCTCPKHEVENLRRMGFRIDNHWNDERQEEGHRAIYGCNFRNGLILPVEPRFILLRKGNVTNASMVNLLEGRF